MRQTSSKDKIQTSIFTFSERSLWMRPNNLEKNFNIHFLNICRTELLHAQLIHFSSSSAFMEFYGVLCRSFANRNCNAQFSEILSSSIFDKLLDIECTN